MDTLMKVFDRDDKASWDNRKLREYENEFCLKTFYQMILPNNIKGVQLNKEGYCFLDGLTESRTNSKKNITIKKINYKTHIPSDNIDLETYISNEEIFNLILEEFGDDYFITTSTGMIQKIL